MLWDARKRYRSSKKGKETARAYSTRYYHNVLKFKPEEVQKRRTANRLNHYRQYGLTSEQADVLKAKGCALCGSKTGKMNIDHDHATGRVRGALCNPCNLMIGWLEKAIPYMAQINQYMEGTNGSVE